MTPTTKTIIKYVAGLAAIGLLLLILYILFSPKAEAQVTDTTTITLSAGAVKAMEAVHGKGWRVRLRSIGRDAMRREVETTKQGYKSMWGEFFFNVEGYEYLTVPERNYIRKSMDSVLQRRARMQAAEAAENQRLADSVAAANEAKRLADSIANAQPTGLLTPQRTAPNRNVSPDGAYYAVYRPALECMSDVYYERGIGKRDFKQVYEAMWKEEPVARNGVLVTPSWEDAWPYVAIIGGIVVLLVLFG